eukprot:g3542.t1
MIEKPIFKDSLEQNSTLDIRSSWRESRSCSSASTQTKESKLAECATQTKRSVPAMTQTEKPSQLHLEEAKEKGAKQFDEQQKEIARFLEKVGQDMRQQLRLNIDSRAFDGFDEMFYTQQDAANDTSAISCKHTLLYEWAECSPEFQARQMRASEKLASSQPCGLECTGVSWSCTGSVVCVSYGRTDHDGWCCHALSSKPALCVWNIFARDFKVDKPQLVYETSSCLTCVECHPSNPALVAVGTFNGEIMVFNIALEDDILIASSLIDDYFHREPVSSIAWISTVEDRVHQIASVSGDGKVLFWDLERKLKFPSRGFRLVPRSKATALDEDSKGNDMDDDYHSLSSSSSSSSSSGRNFGGISLAFSHDGPYSNSFLTGTEGGSIFRSFLRNSSVASKRKDPKGWSKAAATILSRIPLKCQEKIRKHVENYARVNNTNTSEIRADLVYQSKPPQTLLFPSCTGFAFEPHTGPVFSLSCSPFSRNIFLSAGADGQVRLHSMLAKQALYTFEASPTYVCCVQWSKVRPLVFAAGTEAGELLLYDLGKDLHCPVATITPSDLSKRGNVDDSKPAATNCVQFNPKQRDFLASGDASGSVWVWKLNFQLAKRSDSEIEDLNEVCRVREDVQHKNETVK